MQNQWHRLLSMTVLAASTAVAGAQTVKTTISLPTNALGITANPVTNKIYVVAPSISGATTDSIAVIDGKQDVLLQNISVPAGASSVAVNYFTNSIYVAGCDPNTLACIVTVINGKTNAVINTIPVSTTPGLGLTGIVVNPLTGLVYVANANDNVVNIIDGYKNKFAGSISLSGNFPSAIAINIILNRLYVPFGDDETAVIDAGKKQILAVTTFGSDTVGVATNLVTGNVFVTDASLPSATGVLNNKGVVKADVALEDTPLGVDVDPVTNLAFIAGNTLNTVTVIDGSHNTVKAVVPNIPASYVAVNLATEKVYVSGPFGVTVLTEK